MVAEPLEMPVQFLPTAHLAPSSTLTLIHIKIHPQIWKGEKKGMEKVI